MKPDLIDRYLVELARALRLRQADDARALDEARAHLADAVRQGTEHGLSLEDAQREAIDRFGPPEMVAATFPRSSRRTIDRAVLIVAVLAGAGIGYIDSRPNWDDAGITAFAMLVLAGLCGLIAPRRAWRWALAIGLWIPLLALTTELVRAVQPALIERRLHMEQGVVSSLAMFVVLIFPLAGAYGGALMRWAIDAAHRPSQA